MATPRFAASAIVWALGVSATGSAALAQPTASASAAPPAPAPPTRPATSPAEPPPVSAAAACQERIPEGKTRPTLNESFPSRGYTGHVLPLKLVLEHGLGENVLPKDFELQRDNDEFKALEAAGFKVPDPTGPTAPIIERSETGASAKTRVVLPFLALPSEPGRRELTLPSLPIAIARASGEVITLCTKPHSIVLEDPIANTSNPAPKHNTEPRRQLEEWTAAKHAFYGGLIALAAAALIAWLVRWWMKRERPAPPPPPPRPPWEVALEELGRIRAEDLVQKGQLDQHFDRVSDAVRQYLGGRYGFDGLESTTREVLKHLSRVVPPIEISDTIATFLNRADLVKFANVTPTEKECVDALERGEAIVRQTLPEGPGTAGATRPDSDETGGEVRP